MNTGMQSNTYRDRQIQAGAGRHTEAFMYMQRHTETYRNIQQHTGAETHTGMPSDIQSDWQAG